MKPMLLAVLLAALTAFVARSDLAFGGADFFVLHAAAQGVWRGVDVYDQVGQQVALASPVALPPFAYPPWYVLSTSWLGLLPRDVAGRLWMLSNLGMAFATVALLTPGWLPRARAIAFGAATLYVPTLGLLRVGQFTLPVVLGAALLVRSVRGGSALAGGAGLVLLAFKPHVGGFLAVGALPWLLREGRPTLVRGLLLGAGLAAASFLVSPHWPVDYPLSVMSFMRYPANVACDTCSSASAFLADATGGRAAWFSGAILIALLGVIRVHRPDDAMLIATSALAAALALPYLRNYDFVVLIVPMLLAWSGAGRTGRAILVTAWMMPLVMLATTSRATSAHLLWTSALLFLPTLLGAFGDRQADAVHRPESAPPVE